jgi:hypothetical protein
MSCMLTDESMVWLELRKRMALIHFAGEITTKQGPGSKPSVYPIEAVSL